MDLISHLISMPRFCGSFETTDSTANVMSRLECEFDPEKFKPFTRTAFSESVSIYLDKLRINFLEAEAEVDTTPFC
jgi:hypothetical protein